MPRKKQVKKDEAVTLKNVFSMYDGKTERDLYEYLDESLPLTLEVGCGHGDYSLRLALLYPEMNFVGIDVKPSRIYLGAKTALENKMKNIAFLVGRAENLIEFFKSKKVEAIWVPFPDPHVRRKSEFRRLISPALLTVYKSILAPGGVVNFKTDDYGLFEYAKVVLAKEKVIIHKLSEDVYNSEHDQHLHEIQTTYEKRFIEEGRTIRFVSFSFNS